MRPPIINTVLSMIERASKPLLRDFGELSYGHISRQAAPGYCTTAVHRVERKLQEEILKMFPSSQCWLSSGDNRDSINAFDRRKPLWSIVAMDGASNFAHGLPHWALTISLYEHPQITASIVYDPLRFELFWAYRGSGAFLNQKRLRLSTSPWVRPVIACEGLIHPDTLSALHANTRQLGGSVHHWGSPSLALAYTATGRYDGFMGFGLNAMPQRLFAGMLLVKEAGGMISDLTEPGSASPVAASSGVRPALSLAGPRSSWNSLADLASPPSHPPK